MGKQIRSKITHWGLVDSISQENVKRWRFGKRLEESFGHSDTEFFGSLRLSIFYLPIFLIVLIFLVRLFMLTIVGGEKNRVLAEGNRVKLVDIEPKRGKIFDRSGVALAESKDVFLLKRGTQVSEISQSQAKELESQSLAGEDFEGELGQIVHQLSRQYQLGQKTVHVLGYLSGVSPSTRIGRLGVEETYNDFLRGKTGRKIIEVDALGKQVSILGSDPGQDGKDLHLTIDGNLQKVAFDILQKHSQQADSKKAAVVIQNPETGEVLALVSLPSFDPDQVDKYLKDKDEPFFNRVIQGVYPPGSIFKIVSALAGLESGAIMKETEIEDVGEFYLGGSRFANWFYLSYGGRDGRIKIDRAIARSNDIFFYRLAEKTGLDNLREMAKKLGLGQKAGIDLPDESLGLVPDETWKKSAYGQDWYLGDTLHLGIGQGFVLSTPLQMNKITSFMASGKLTKPYLVTQIDSQDGNNIKMEGKILAASFVGEENFQIVRQGMRQACEKGGTGWPFFNATYKVGCKTGTAEKALGNPHAWFTAFAPFDNPQVSVTVIIEEGGEGSSVAGPVAREILDWWMVNRLQPD